MDIAAELRATSDLLLLDLQALGELEELKRTVPHGDPKLVDIASRIEELARKVLYGSQHQLDLTETITGAAGAAGAADPATAQQISTIDDVRSASAILSEWREAERRAQELEPGSAAHAEALREVDRARSEYRRAFEAARKQTESRG